MVFEPKQWKRCAFRINLSVFDAPMKLAIPLPLQFQCVCVCMCLVYVNTTKTTTIETLRNTFSLVQHSCVDKVIAVEFSAKTNIRCHH